jgi:hypothetical protein
MLIELIAISPMAETARENQRSQTARTPMVNATSTLAG